METAAELSATLAILIDADNARPSIFQGLMDEVAKLGRAGSASHRYCGGGAGGGSGKGGAPGEHCHPGKQVCAGSQISPGIHMVPAVGVGVVPGLHCQPAWHICPASQISPGMHIADFVGLGLGHGLGAELSGDVGPGDVGGIAEHPTSSSSTTGQIRMTFSRRSRG
jgi:hypothetical protein